MILSPFNTLFFIMIALEIAVIVLIWFIFRNKTEKTKKVFIVALCSFNIVLFFVYKYFLSIDTEYVVICGLDRFNWFNELPLHLCNINMFLIPIGVIFNKKYIKGFSFIMAPLGAALALLFPSAGFFDAPIYLPRMLGYYATHLLIIICGLCIATLGFYRPKPSDFLGISVFFLIVSFLAHIINTVFRVTALCAEANYFYTYDHMDISILKIFWDLFESVFGKALPYLYELPALLILAVYMLIISLIFKFLVKPKDGTLAYNDAAKEKEKVKI